MRILKKYHLILYYYFENLVDGLLLLLLFISIFSLISLKNVKFFYDYKNQIEYKYYLIENVAVNHQLCQLVLWIKYIIQYIYNKWHINTVSNKLYTYNF